MVVVLIRSWENGRMRLCVGLWVTLFVVTTTFPSIKKQMIHLTSRKELGSSDGTILMAPHMAHA